MQDLREWVQHPGYLVFRDLLQELTEQLAVGMLRPLGTEESNFLRGRLFGLREVYDLCDRVIAARDQAANHRETIRERFSTNGDAPTDRDRHWGSDFWTDLNT